MFWEKTVEYAFLWRAAQAEIVDFASPMSGKQERGAGDAIFGKDAKLLLIEFKASIDDLKTERDKFDDYPTAKELLGNSDDHHFFVYGRKDESRLALGLQNFFSEKTINFTDIHKYSAGQIFFKKYLLQFLALRKRDERGAGKIQLSDYTSIIGFNLDNKIVQACTLSEYAQHIFPSIMNEFEITENSDSPGMKPRM
ncbi:hypothetical protein [Thermomonas aquatica]|uniref:Uncharacterized protein n=1 Tax=Thermomonas aquatica TaxID=2202149 RepID=A0A5B7ZPL2_9GAMM|nr:hypothetical protein [Thermomonas aquatica]QDA56493.1 hypothetical protein FHQ07_03775 [Thermomonas aquatica]